jgi:hypothetical protein
MNVRRTDWQDLLFGLFLIIVAGIALVATRNLSGGNAADMGPGYIPRAIAIMLLAFGLWFSIRGLRRPFVGIAPVRLQPLFAITASVAVFALTASRLGLALSSFAAILIASLATREARPVESAVFALALSTAAVLLFVKVLGLPVPIWPRTWF